ncbi:CoA transferase [Pseudomonas veronii]|jgi:crotonobetainyl-CoA:carnitine CoA-transferase CaiB-like acyl-CoA transferase|uniref:Formyl-CoA:oxalate CoA-transferase n=3 Tax=Pseudomonas fluorescens group TaxID=136843 RepID=A0A5E6P4B0_PSEFL|nr:MULTISPECIES: CoA transferase [Pseudomonas]MDZ4325635.1 CoA transferase [Pseudomonas sp.]SEC72702.1 Crotonobetainyl-CoA:carnitine CoA-transferase CaiB [Pseudomonas marginalis]KAA0975504.1 CoA transferase [Pseudomonas sp. ANT_H12B]KRP76140.1 acyl-CoA transferase [Pseudomonas veronii]MBF6037842.1 CoA transferase [Pseudomonas mucoides]
MSQAILEGIRVISLCSGIAGSAAGMHLCEAGAEVVMIEPPANRAREKQALFAVLNRGKRSVILCLENAADRQQLNSLLASADVLLHDFTPAVAQAHGLADAQLTADFPRLVISAISGWPHRHALANSIPRETLILARLGLLDEQPAHRPGPVFVRMPFANWLASWLCVVGVMARLLARDRDGCGGIAHTSLAQAALVPMTMHWNRAQTPTPAFAKGLDKHIPIPLHQCADGRWLHVHYSPDKSPWMAAALSEFGETEVARLNALWPSSHVAPNFGANKAIIATRSAQEWVEHFWQHDVAAQIAAPFGDIYFDEQARLNGYVVEVDDVQLGKTLQPGPAWQVQPPARVGGSAPLAGEGNAGLSGADAVIPSQLPRSSPAPLPPLHGLKVLDLGAYLAGPFACMLLADLGAEVIKIEAPKGDAMRRLERIFSGTQRGKLGVALQLGDRQTEPAVEALARWADVVHHNMRLPAARKLKVDYESLKALNPQLVYCHVSAYGPTGPRTDWPGFDQLMQASCGWEVEQGGEGQAPMWLRFGVGDFFAGLSSLYALLLGLYERNRSGVGQMVSSSLLGATMLSMSEAVVLEDGSLTPIDHLDAQQTGLSDAHRLYRCSDSWLVVAALQPDEVQRFERLVDDQPETWFADQTRQAALASLVAAQVPAQAVLEAQMDAFLDSPEHAEAGLHAHYSHAVYGDLQQIGAFWDFGNLPLSLQRPPPALGQHTRQVLEGLGFTGSELERLASVGLVAL